MSDGASRSIGVIEQAIQGPLLGMAAEFERCGDVEQHPLGEEVVEFLGRGPGLVADGLVEAGELLTDRGPDIRVATRRIGLQLDTEQVPIFQ